jgi:membrane-bound ClpP family serine protease
MKHQLRKAARTALSLLALPLFFCACGDDDDGLVCESRVTYQQIASTLDKSCAGCHASTLTGADRNQAPVGVNLDTYAGASRNPSSIVRVIRNGTMPPSGTVPKADADAIECWSKNGAPEK